MRIFWGSIGIVIGILLIKYAYRLISIFGKFDWAERYLSGGFGGTYFFYKLAGMALVFLSALYMFGILEYLLGPLGSVFGGLAPK